MATVIRPEILDETLKQYIAHKGNQVAMAHALGVSRGAVQNRLFILKRKGTLPTFEDNRVSAPPVNAEFTVGKLPDPELPIEELIAHRIKQFGKKKEYEDARRLVPVHIHIDGPIGVWHFGDPHLDDDGTDLETIQRHVGIINKTPGLFGANVGDHSNNWIGRLARLWSDQSTSSKQAWRLVEWFITSTPWLYLIGGNHDGWSGEGDPVKWMMHGQTAPYSPSEIRLQIKFPNKQTCNINARHDFTGHSQYNPVHGPMKANLFGARDHIAVAGHKHISGHGVLKNPDNHEICHSFLVAGYKIYDRYALEKGFRDQRISPGVLTVINPDIGKTHPDYVTHFWDLEHGAEYLTFLRRKYAKSDGNRKRATK